MLSLQLSIAKKKQYIYVTNQKNFFKPPEVQSMILYIKNLTYLVTQGTFDHLHTFNFNH